MNERGVLEREREGWESERYTERERVKMTITMTTFYKRG
jgi:hypothetical protein